MTKREIVFLACRLMAIYLFMSSFFELSRSLSNFNPFNHISTSITGTQSLVIQFNGRPATTLELAQIFLFRFMPVICCWIGATLLWFLARDIAIRMFENEAAEITEGASFSFGAEVRAVAFGCLGLFFLAQDIPRLLLWIVTQIWPLIFWTTTRPFFGYGYLSWEWIIRIPLCLWLLFGLRGLGGLWRLAQEKGIAPTR